MRYHEGRITEIRAGPDGAAAGWIQCDGGCLPAPGQYLLAWAPADAGAALAEVVFPGEIGPEGFLAIGVPSRWGPGERLLLQGPLGRGFQVPGTTRRLALAGLGSAGGPAARLLPLVAPALAAGAEVTVFVDELLPGLPAAVEVSPLPDLPAALGWADFLALDVPASELASLRAHLGLSAGERLPCPAEALIRKPMPCGGIAGCGACAVPTRKTGGAPAWRLACVDGPVFNLEEIDW